MIARHRMKVLSMLKIVSKEFNIHRAIDHLTRAEVQLSTAVDYLERAGLEKEDVQRLREDIRELIGELYSKL